MYRKKWTKNKKFFTDEQRKRDKKISGKTLILSFLEMDTHFRQLRRQKSPEKIWKKKIFSSKFVFKRL